MRRNIKTVKGTVKVAIALSAFAMMGTATPVLVHAEETEVVEEVTDQSETEVLEEACEAAPSEVWLMPEENNSVQEEEYSYRHEADEGTESAATTLISVKNTAGQNSAQQMADQLVASYGNDVVNGMISYLDDTKRDIMNGTYASSDFTYDDIELVERMLMQAQVNNRNNTNTTPDAPSNTPSNPDNREDENQSNSDNREDENQSNPDNREDENQSNSDNREEESSNSDNGGETTTTNKQNVSKDEESSTTTDAAPATENRSGSDKTTFRNEYDEEAENIINGVLTVGKYSEDALNQYVNGLRESLGEDVLKGVCKYITHCQLDIEAGLDNSGRSFEDLEYVRNALLTAGMTKNDTPNPAKDGEGKGDKKPSTDVEKPSQDDKDPLDVYLDTIDKAEEAYDKAEEVCDKAKEFLNPNKEAKELIPEVAGELKDVAKDLEKFISDNPNSLYAKSAKDTLNKINGILNTLDKVKNGQLVSVKNQDYDFIENKGTSELTYKGKLADQTDQMKTMVSILRSQGWTIEEGNTPEVTITISPVQYDGTVQIMIYENRQEENITYMTEYRVKPVETNNADNY